MKSGKQTAMKKHSHTRRHRDSRHGAKQPEVFNPARAALLDSPDRFDYLPPERIFAHLDPPQGGLVVDFGAGTGRFSIELAQRRPDLKVIALDEQPEMLKLLEAKPAAQQLAQYTAHARGRNRFLERRRRPNSGHERLA